MAKKSPQKRYRSAITGYLVDRDYAEKHPDTTVSEIINERNNNMTKTTEKEKAETKTTKKHETPKPLAATKKAEVPKTVDGADGKTPKTLDEAAKTVAPDEELSADTIDDAAMKASEKSISEAAENIKVEPITPDEAQVKAASKANEAEYELINDELTETKALKRYVAETVPAIMQTNPEACADLTEAQINKIVRRAVEDEIDDLLEQRRTPELFEAEIKTNVKTKFTALAQQFKNTRVRSEKVKDALAEMATGANSPLPVSPEAILEAAKRENDPDSPEALAEVEKEKERLSNLSSGRVPNYKDLEEGRFYNFVERQTDEMLKNAQTPKTFVGKILGKPTLGNVEIVRIENGRETTRTEKVRGKDFDINEVPRERAFELSMV